MFDRRTLQPIARSLRSSVGVLLLSAALTTSAWAATITIAPDGTGDYPTLAEGLDAAVSGDTVVALAGNYAEPGMSVPDGVTLRGATGDRNDVVVQLTGTIPDMSALGTAYLRDFTLRSSHVGVRLYFGTVVDLENVTIEDCGTRAFIQTDGSLGEVIARNCTFQRSLRGVGRAAYDLVDCQIVDNLQGIQIEGVCSFRNCLFDGNGGTREGNDATSLTLANCQFVDQRNSALLYFSGTATVDSTSFTDCEAALWGGGTLTVEDCSFMDCGDAIRLVAGGGTVRDCDLSGVGMRVTNASFNVLDCSGDGAVLRLDVATLSNLDLGSTEHWGRVSGSHVTITDCTLRRLSSVSVGTGIITNCEFIDLSGGLGASHLEMTDTILRVDQYSWVGGVSIGSGWIRNSTVEAMRQNPLRLSGDGPVELRNSRFNGRDGGAFSAATDDPSQLTVSCCTIHPMSGDYPNILAYLENEAVNTHLLATGDCGPGTGFDVPANSVAAPTIDCPQIGATIVGTCPASGIYVATQPRGFDLVADADTIPSGSYVPATPGQQLALSAPEFIDFPTPGSRWVFDFWNTGEPREHLATVASYDDFFEASYGTEHEFTLEQEGPGTITGDTDDGYYAPGTVLQLVAAPAPVGGVFVGWEGDGDGSYTGTDLSIQVTIGSEPITQTAIFTGFSDVTIDTNPPGLNVLIDNVSTPTPFMATWEFGEVHTFEVPNEILIAEGSRYLFNNWEGTPARLFGIVVGPGGYSNTATFDLQHSVDFEAGRNGAILNQSIPFVNAGTDIQIEAIPDDGFELVGWTGTGDGSYTGTDNPAQVTVNGPIVQAAEFFDPTADLAEYDFTLSASDANPFAHTGTPTGLPREVHVWMTCTNRGLAAVEFRIESNSQVLDFLPAPNVLNVGSTMEPLLAIGGCPTGPQSHFRLGSILIVDNGATLCLGPTTTSGLIGAVDCDQDNPVLTLDPGVAGFSSESATICERGTNGCLGTISVRLSQLRAEAGDRKVHVRWQTTSEVDHAGFRIYRSAGISGPWDLISGEELFVGASPYDFADADVLPDRRSFYEVGAVDTRGHEDRYGPIEITTPQWRQFVTGLAPVRPNPFTRQADIAFSLAAPGPAKLEIFDVTGRLVRRLVDGVRPAGEHVATWDGRDGSGQVVPAGVYFSRFEAGGVQQSKKIVRTGTR